MIIIKNAMENYYIRTEILHASFIQNKEKIRYQDLNLVNIGLVVYTKSTFPKETAYICLLRNKYPHREG